MRSQLPWSATAGRDLNADGFNTDLVPGTARNAGQPRPRPWRRSTRGAPSTAAPRFPTARSSRRASTCSTFEPARRSASARPTKVDLVAQLFNVFNTDNLQAQYGGGRVTNASPTPSAASPPRGPAVRPSSRFAWFGRTYDRTSMLVQLPARPLLALALASRRPGAAGAETRDCRPPTSIGCARSATCRSRPTGRPSCTRSPTTTVPIAPTRRCG